MKAGPLYVQLLDFPNGDGYQTLPTRFYDESGTGSAVIGPCVGCRNLFMFNPVNVIAIRLSVPDMRPNPDPREASEKFPICNACTERGNAARVKRGLDPMPLSKDSSR